MNRLGDEIVWTGNLADPNSLRQGAITKIQGDLRWVDYQHKPEDCIYLAYCWPAKYKAELADILRKRRELKEAFDDSMSLIYQLRNKIAREET